jgi:hypothetical protein
MTYQNTVQVAWLPTFGSEKVGYGGRQVAGVAARFIQPSLTHDMVAPRQGHLADAARGLQNQ